jgi:hypothetical protein
VLAWRTGIPVEATSLVLSMLAKEPRERPSAEEVYDALLPLTSAPGGPPEADENRDPTRPFRRPQFVPARRRESTASHGELGDAEADLLVASVRRLLDGDRPSEAISLLEDGVECAGHDMFLERRLRHFLPAALSYAGEYTRAAPLFDAVGREYRKYLQHTDAYVLDCSYHAGHSYAETGKPEKALPQLRFYVQNAYAAAAEDEEEKVLESRFVIAQMLAAAGHSDEALTELEVIRPLLADTFGVDSTRPATSTSRSAGWEPTGGMAHPDGRSNAS